MKAQSSAETLAKAEKETMLKTFKAHELPVLPTFQTASGLQTSSI